MCRIEMRLRLWTYIDVPYDDCVAIAVKKVVAFWVSIDDDGQPSGGEGQRGEHSLCGKKIHTREENYYTKQCSYACIKKALKEKDYTKHEILIFLFSRYSGYM